MVSDRDREKYERAFDTFDSDRDGRITWSDVQVLIDRFEGGPGIQSFYQMYWQELVGLSGGDEDGLWRDAFIEAQSQLEFSPSQEDTIQSAADSIFQSIANDGGDEIAKDEFVNLLRRVWGTDDLHAADAFRQLGPDRDGRVSRQEFVQAAQKHFFTTHHNVGVSAAFFSEL
ncbi:hypothetical protein AB0F17_43020 [Nonomuraea sp. NPDC026600]|uniref:EF-hand domain-containing protein n=1 Tax=Nonomuraea sp. NPDC026600 TaxID=3155363 RepID=UPI003407BC2F